jgi:uncharacterized secreted protein with C-terminal beta-propeller domain
VSEHTSRSNFIVVVAAAAAAAAAAATATTTATAAVATDGDKNEYMNKNSEIHNINSRCSSDLHTSTANLTIFQKGPFYFVIKAVNHLHYSLLTPWSRVLVEKLTSLCS